jgi:hypothetical protein
MDERKETSLGNLDSISFSDDDNPEEGNDHAGHQGSTAATYFEKEGESHQGEEYDRNWEEEVHKDIEPQKKPFYLRPMFLIVILIVFILAVTLAISLSKQKKRKAVSFGEESQQFSQPPPSIPNEVVATAPAAPIVNSVEQEPVAPVSAPPVTTASQEAQAMALAVAPAAATPSPVAAAQSMVAPVATLQAQPQSSGSGNNELIALENRMKAELRDISSRNLALQREVRQLTERVNRLTKGSAAASGTVSQKTILTEAAQPQDQAVPASPIAAFSIKAIRKGQAWVASSSGTYTVNVGDMLPGNIRVTGIDPDNLEVATSAGVIRYKK